MLDLWIIRHGETYENLHAICQGQNPGKLTEKGQQQAEALGSFLKDELFDVYYSSDLKRTMDSMQKVADCHGNPTILPEPLLRERYLAAWQGKPFPANWKTIEPPHGAETVEDLLLRAGAFIRKIRQTHSNQKIAIMTHGGLIRALWTVLSPKQKGYFDWESPVNTGVSRFQLLDKGQVIEVFLNQSTHLTGHNGELTSKNNTEWQL